MDVIVRGERVRLDDADLLGAGGEGRVYRAGARAIKVFHAGADPKKLAKVRDFPRGLPPSVIAPLDVALDGTGNVVGYAMNLVSGAVDALRLAQRRWRHGALSNAAVCALMRRLHAVLGQIHARGVVVGDLNDGNVVFTRASAAPPSPYLIDCDSMQTPGHLCTVAHERFLDPLLYGADLTKVPAFTPATDWYAFSVLLFASLLYVHPYGGQHPSIGTLLRRAEARVSILRPEVAVPRAATHWRVLSDDMLHAFAAVFDRGARGVFPERVLDARWTACSCGVEHARAACPECAAKVAIPAARAVGRCRARSVFTTRGRVLAAAFRGKLEYAYEENGALHREDGARLPVAAGPSARVAVMGGVTWLFDDGRAAKIAHGAVTERHDADAFDADLSGAYVAHGGWLGDAESGARLGQVIGKATWLRAGPRFAIGFYRAGKVTIGFVVRPGRGMKSVPLPPVVGKLVDATATFDRDEALVTIATEHDGRRTHAVHLVSSDGAVLASASGPPESRPILGFGACMAFGAILLPTDDGLVLARADLSAATFREDKSFPETRDFVASGADLLAGPHGSVYLVHTGEVVHLSLV